jgi:hypothetical protein
MNMSSVEGARVARENLRRGQSVTEESMSQIEQNFSTSFDLARNFNLKIIEMMRAHADAAFDLAQGLITAKSPPEAFAACQSFAERQVDTVQKQAGQLAAMTQTAASETAQTARDTADRFAKSA